MIHSLLFAPFALAVAAPAEPAAAPVAPALAPSEIVAVAPAGDWVSIEPDDLLVMTLAPDARGRERRMVIQLMPAPFSQGWVGNIRRLAAARWWDGLSINRVQDNYVVQWGDADGEDAAKARALPAGLLTMPESQYRTRIAFGETRPNVCIGQGLDCPEWRRTPPLTTVSAADSYARTTGFFRGWPVAVAEEREPVPGDGGIVALINTYSWPIHCYGMVGVGRNLSPDTGSGAELYAVIGHAPRHLDRNIAVVGRVIEGIEHLSSLPRGTGALGFYETPEERTGIASIRLASTLPEGDRPAFEYLSTESASFQRYADARANRRDAFFIQPAGGADICNVPVPVRRRAR